MGGTRTLALAAALVSLGFLAAPASAVTLTSGNSSIVIDPAFGSYDWQVQGQTQLFYQWFFFGFGFDPATSGGQQSVSSLGLIATQVGNNIAIVSGSGQGLSLNITYTLVGGSASSNVSDVAETISITNTTAAPINLRFYQYSDFDLLGTAGGDSAMFTNVNTVDQWEGPVALSETVVTPVPTRREIADYPDLINNINSPAFYQLANTPLNTIVGPGDITWAYEWDVTIDAGGTFIVSKDKHLVIPEPVTMFSAFMAISGLGLYIRKRTKANA